MESIVILIILVALIPWYKYFKRKQFDLHGMETIFLELSVIFGIHIGQYYPVEILDNILRFLSVYFITIWAFYYLIKTIKTNKSTSILIIISYMILVFGMMTSLNFIPTEGMGGLGLAAAGVIAPLVITAYVVVLNIVSWIIRKIKKVNIEKEKLNFNFLKLMLVVFLGCVPYIQGYFGQNILVELKAHHMLGDYLKSEYNITEYVINEKKTNYEGHNYYYIYVNVPGVIGELEFEYNSVNMELIDVISVSAMEQITGIKIIGKTELNTYYWCVDNKEKIYEDKEHEYFLHSCMSSDKIYVIYPDGTRENIKEALDKGRIPISYLEKFRVDHIKEPKY